MARRRRRPEAFQLFDRAISLAKDLGDVQAQVESLLNMASAYVDELRLDEAQSAVDQAEALLDRAETLSESASRLLSIRGNISWAQDDFEVAGSLYRAAAARSDGSDRIESLAAALLTLARTRQRDRYRRHLARLTREAQQTGYYGVLAEGLLPSAEEWLRAEARRLSGRTYADAIELALVQCTHDMPVEAEDQEAPTAPLSEADSPLSDRGRLDLLVRVIVRTVVGITAVPAIGPGVTRDIAARLRHDLPSGVNGILLDWLQQASAVVSEGVSSQSEASGGDTGVSTARSSGSPSD
jgi:hypothetical protein